MEIKVKYFDSSLPKISFSEKGDWVDLYVRGNYLVKKGKSIMVKFNIATELPEGYEAHIAPRSSTFKIHGLILTNGVGVVDNSYNGDEDEWCGLFYATKDTIIHEGVRLTQFRIMETMDKSIEFTEVESLDNDSRGGYGTSGI